MRKPVWIFLLALSVFAQGLRRPGQPARPPAETVDRSEPVFRAPSGAFSGSVISGQLQPGELSLSLAGAIARGLESNLGPVLAQDTLELARGARLRALSALLPNLNAVIAQSVQQVNLAAFGFPGLPGIRSIVGPFQVFDARAFLSYPALNLSAIARQRADAQNESAARLSYSDARDFVVLTVTQLYLEAVAGAARIATARAQLATGEALYTQATDLKNAGVAAGIDVLRADVERQDLRQRLLFVESQWEKQKLRLARAIGLPLEQTFSLSDAVSYTPPPPLTPEQSLQTAYQSRADYQSASAALRAAVLARKAAQAERYPSVDFNADYGAIGQRIYSSHGTFSAAGAVRFPIFNGGRIRADIVQAEAAVAEQRAQLENLRGQIDFELRTALLDLHSANDQVQVARNAVDLAEQQLTQARDRFKAGVANTVEVVQAQEAVAAANENYISALFAYNAAKASLARAMGQSEKRTLEFLGIR